MDSVETYAICTAVVIVLVNLILLRSYLGFVRPIPGSRKLVVTAHPDDETMFFSPFIAWESSKGSNIHLICLSNGNYDGQGLLRSEELREACHELGVSAQFLYLVNSPKFQDNPKIVWNAIEIQQIIVNYCQNHDIQAVVSFDSRGVSGHSNHVSIHRALDLLSKDASFRPRIYTLDSVSIVRKYNSLLDILCTMIWAPDHMYSLDSKLNDKPQRAMLKYHSQLVWFRHLYRWFSKYMIINTFSDLTAKKSQ